jgi:hypothetical protein
MARLFISYRREDAGYVAAVLNDRLQQKFGPDSVFFDIDHVPLGADFREHIAKAVGHCDVLLVVIGDDWLDVCNATGGRRLDDPADYHRIEIEAALARGIPTIPILIDKATMPSPDRLPESLQAMAYRNAAELRAGKDFPIHVDRLILGLERLLAMPGPEPQQSVAEPTAQDPAPTGRPKAATVPAERGSSAKKKTGGGAHTSGATPVRKRSVYRPGLRDVADQIHAHLVGLDNEALFLGKAIPKNKLANALASYGSGLKASDVLALYDNTAWGGSRDGFLLTRGSIRWHNLMGKAGQRRFDEIEKVSCEHNRLNSALIIDGEQIEVQMGQGQAIAEAIVKLLRKLSMPGR